MRTKAIAVGIFLTVSCGVIAITLDQKVRQGSDRHLTPGTGVDTRSEHSEKMIEHPHAPDSEKGADQGKFVDDILKKSKPTRRTGESAAAYQTRLRAWRTKLKKSGPTHRRASSSALRRPSR